MELAFHIVVIVLFTLQTIGRLIRCEMTCDTGIEFFGFITYLFVTVWAWLHLFKVW